jgi:hypothetical protein
MTLQTSSGNVTAVEVMVFEVKGLPELKRKARDDFRAALEVGYVERVLAEARTGGLARHACSGIART